MTWFKCSELVGVHDKIGELMNTDVVDDENIDDKYSEPNEADDDLDRGWGLEGFVADEEN